MAATNPQVNMMVDPADCNTPEKMQGWAIWHQADADGRWNHQDECNEQNRFDHQEILRRLCTIERKIIRWVGVLTGVSIAAGYFLGGKFGGL